jgi:hypothetical protein
VERDRKEERLLWSCDIFHSMRPLSLGDIASCTEAMSGSLRVHGSWQNHDIATKVGARAHEKEEGNWEKRWKTP